VASPAPPMACALWTRTVSSQYMACALWTWAVSRQYTASAKYIGSAKSMAKVGRPVQRGWVAYSPCPCPCPMSMSMSHVHVHVPCPCPCPWTWTWSPCPCPCTHYSILCAHFALACLPCTYHTLTIHLPCTYLHLPCTYHTHAVHLLGIEGKMLGSEVVNGAYAYDYTIEQKGHSPSI